MDYRAGLERADGQKYIAARAERDHGSRVRVKGRALPPIFVYIYLTRGYFHDSY